MTETRARPSSVDTKFADFIRAFAEARADQDAESGERLGEQAAFVARFVDGAVFVLFETAVFLHKLALAQEIIDGYAAQQALDPAQPSIRALLHEPCFPADPRAQAERHYRAVLEMRPTFLRAAFNLGVMLIERGEIDAAEALLRRAADDEALAGDAQAALARIGRFSGGRTGDDPGGDTLAVADALRARGELSRSLYFYSRSLQPGGRFRADFDPAAPPPFEENAT